MQCGRGMCSTLPLMPDQVHVLRSRFAVCGTASGRFNVAGIPGDRIPCRVLGIAGVLAEDREPVSATRAVSRMSE